MRLLFWRGAPLYSLRSCERGAAVSETAWMQSGAPEQMPSGQANMRQEGSVLLWGDDVEHQDRRAYKQGQQKRQLDSDSRKELVRVYLAFLNRLEIR